ncbi:MAG: hypothetical protein CIT01_06925 [Methanobacterium sp. BRmetb2]|jgi:hypothetical protein|nr:MAG: hypothetical protein CIT01_06925 [Methanobacterium sp. BRmetb2]
MINSEIPSGIEGKLEKHQIKLYRGLRKLGEDISDLYLDGINLLKRNEFRAKSNYLAHTAREIDGGIRDVLSREKDKKIIQKRLNKGEFGNISKYKEDMGHVASILTALNCDLESEIAKEWIDVATKFARLAHRDSKNRRLRDPSETEDLWKRYEKVLLWLVGEHYNYLERIDRILSYKEPSEEQLNALNQLIGNEAVYTYFFANLEFIKWLKPLKERGYFDLDNIPKRYELPDRPGTISRPPFMPLFYLKKLVEKNQENPNQDVVDISIEIINSIIDNYGSVNNGWIDYIILDMISILPASKIENKHIEFIRTILKSSKWDKSFTSADIKEILSALIKGKRKDLILHLIDIMFDFTVERNQPIPIMDPFWLNESLKEYKGSIYGLCGIEAANVALGKIKEITDFNPQFEVSAIDDHPQNMFPDDYNCQLVHFVRDIYDSLNPQDINDLLKNLINEKALIFKKLAIHTINHHYTELKDLFWDWNGNPLNSEIRHEVYMLLKVHFSSFDDSEIRKLIAWIKDVKYYIPDEYKDNQKEKDKREAIAKLKWLNSIKESKNEKIQEIYKRYKKIYPKEIKHPDFDVWHGETIVLIPKKPKKLCEKPNKEIAEYLNASQQENEILPIFTEEGSYESFTECASSNPNKFSKDLEPLLNIPRKNQHELFDGLLNALRNGKHFEWEEILDFIEKIIDSETFWKEKYSNFNYRDWIISTIADIINEKTKNDNYPFKKELLPKISDILIKLADKTDSELYLVDDIVTSVLNSPRGKIYYAMVNFSLSYARLYKEDYIEKWCDSIKQYIEKNLNNPPIELSVVLSEYLPFIFYLDKNWAIQNIDRIFCYKNWEDAFSGYIYHSNPIYEEIYEILKEKGYYEKAINTNFKDKITSENLVYQLCSAYLFDCENLDGENSLIHKLIQKKDPALLSEIVSFFLLQKNENYEIAKLKIKPTWKVLFDLVSQNPDNFKGFIADVSRWLVFFDEIDDELFEWLMLSAKYLKRGSNHRLIVENLLNCVEKSPKKVAEIFIEMLNNGAYPDYKQENIVKIVEILYEKGEKESADKICNLYGERNVHFLREIYKKYNEF